MSSDETFYISNATCIDRFGIESISRMIMDKHLHWLGHAGRVDATMQITKHYAVWGDEEEKTCTWAKKAVERSKNSRY